MRNAPIFAPRTGASGYAVYFGDTGANVYALDAGTGAQLWMVKVDEHPFARVTGSPTLYGSLLYVPVSSLEETAASQPGYECCTFRGSVAALDTAHRRDGLEDLHDSRAEADRQERSRDNAAGAGGRRHLVVADGRPEARRHLRGNRQHLRGHDR